MRVLLATGIFFPDVGGPATHVRHVAEEFSRQGWEVTVVAFGDSVEAPEGYRVVRVSRRGSKLLYWLRYMLLVIRESARKDALYAFDLTTAGVPVALAAKFRRTPFLLRIGGDPIWERVVEHGKRFLPMEEYYRRSLHRVDRPWLFLLTRWVVRRADRVVTYCQFLRDVFVEHYGVPGGRVAMVRNPAFRRSLAPREPAGTFTFLFAGRFVTYKNLPMVVRAFARLHRERSDVRLRLIGEGQDAGQLNSAIAESGCTEAISVAGKMDQAALFVEIAHSSVALAPALTEFNPNFILEALSFGKPALISRGNGLSVSLPEALLFDPLNEEGLLAAMRGVADSRGYDEAIRAVAELPLDWGWPEVVARHVEFVEEVAGEIARGARSRISLG